MQGRAAEMSKSLSAVPIISVKKKNWIAILVFWKIFLLSFLVVRYKTGTKQSLLGIPRLRLLYFCIDYKKLSVKTDASGYPAQEDQQNTTLVTHIWLYRFRYMPRVYRKLLSIPIIPSKTCKYSVPLGHQSKAPKKICLTTRVRKSFW